MVFNNKYNTYPKMSVKHGKMNGTATTNRLQNSFKIKDNNVHDHRIIEILGLRPSNRLPVSY
jgi:hypothetical protein